MGTVLHRFGQINVGKGQKSCVCGAAIYCSITQLLSENDSPRLMVEEGGHLQLWASN